MRPYSNNKYIVLIFAFAFIVRTLFVLLLPLSAPDTGLYDGIAQNLLSYGNYSLDNTNPDIAKPPLYPFFLMVVYGLFGHSFLLVRIIQSVIDSGTCVFVFLIAVRIFGNSKIGLVASIIASVYPEIVASCSYVLTETLTTFLITIAVYFLTVTLGASEIQCWGRQEANPTVGAPTGHPPDTRPQDTHGAPTGHPRGTHPKDGSGWIGTGRDVSGWDGMGWSAGNPCKYPGNWLTATGSGIFLGMATLCRPITLLFPLALIFTGLLFRMHRSTFLSFIWISIAMILTITPWTIRNYLVFKKFIPVGIGSGSNLWLGSYLPWDGDYNYKDLSDKTQVECGLPPIEADEKLRQEAIKNIKDAPLGYLYLGVKKFGRFWLQVPGNKNVLRNTPLVARIIVYSAYFFVLLFFILGLVSLSKHWNNIVIPSLLMIGYYTLMHVMLFTIPRYRIPIIPLVIVISAFGVYRCVEYIKWAPLQKK